MVVDFDDAEGVRAGALRRQHRRARELADLAQLDDLVTVGGCRRRGGCHGWSRCCRAAGAAAGFAGAGAGAAAAGVAAAAAGAGAADGAGARSLAAGDGVDVVEDIVAGDPPTGTCPGDRRWVEAVLVDEAAHHGRQQTPGGAGRDGLLGGGCRCRLRGRGGSFGGSRRLGRRCLLSGGLGGLGSGSGSFGLGSGRRRLRCRGLLRLGCRSLGCRLLGRFGRWRRRRRLAALVDHGDHRADGHRLSFGDADLGHRAGNR